MFTVPMPLPLSTHPAVSAPFRYCASFFFFFNDTATTEIYTLSLHDALPISIAANVSVRSKWGRTTRVLASRIKRRTVVTDRKSTRLNSSHVKISYAVFCLKKKNLQRQTESK